MQIYIQLMELISPYSLTKQTYIQLMELISPYSLTKQTYIQLMELISPYSLTKQTYIQLMELISPDSLQWVKAELPSILTRYEENHDFEQNISCLCTLKGTVPRNFRF